MIRPSALRPGDLVQLVGTSGWVRPEGLAAAEEVLTGWGLRPRAAPHALSKHFYLSGTDEERANDLNEAFRDPEVRAVLCLRGGYGAQRIVDDLDFAAVRADPKLFMGFSDITALHVALWCEAGLATIHGPVAAFMDPDEDTRRILMTSDPITVSADETETTYEVQVPGRAEGTLLGGNLTMLATTAGTRHKPDLSGAILLLETTDEEPYRIDRSIVQLKRAGWLDNLAGIALGQFTNCTDDGPTPTVQQVLAEQFGSLGIPVLGGLPIGHGKGQTAIPLGTPAVLDTKSKTLTAEPAGT